MESIHSQLYRLAAAESKTFNTLVSSQDPYHTTIRSSYNNLELSEEQNYFLTLIELPTTVAPLNVFTCIGKLPSLIKYTLVKLFIDKPIYEKGRLQPQHFIILVGHSGYLTNHLKVMNIIKFLPLNDSTLGKAENCFLVNRRAATNLKRRSSDSHFNRANTDDLTVCEPSPVFHQLVLRSLAAGCLFTFPCYRKPKLNTEPSFKKMVATVSLIHALIDFNHTLVINPGAIHKFPSESGTISN
ncbi:hypothetical protein Glove_478g23 [Diversispora epigaea]|uniref:Uncharacterized protein n=1 Tax=Diversispora epigaea TaxID=1348612 RepID=A0A397GKE3_9GLOM|nr:hypothetical protein Glove_478g23 [Diversispora epigaea]